ncbi:SDR family oxidoreductase [Bacillota bacterium]
MREVYIVTGGSSGIGLECAKVFKDAAVVITGRNESRLIKAKEELLKAGIDAHYKTGDIADRDSVKALFEFAGTLGKIKGVINSAGVSGTSADAALTFKIDLIGTENLINETYAIAEERTVLILISSMMGHIVPSNPQYDQYLENPSQEGAIDALLQVVNNNPDFAYNFSKKGVHLLVKKHAAAFGKKGARIVSVSPGIIMTPMAEEAAAAHPEQMNYMKSMTPAGRNGIPEDIANAVAFLADDKASFITGTDLTVDGGLTVSLPEIMKAYAK